MVGVKVQRRDGAARSEPGVDAHIPVVVVVARVAVVGHVDVAAQSRYLLEERVLRQVPRRWSLATCALVSVTST